MNVPYDCGVAIVVHPEPLSSTMGIRASYLMSDAAGPADPQAKVPELSRRARGVPVWAVLRSLGREGVADFVARLAHGARSIAEQIAAINAQVLNDVVYTQASVAFGDDERTRDRSRRGRRTERSPATGNPGLFRRQAPARRHVVRGRRPRGRIPRG
ncbi:pyridoxal-dependent decarboxylase [Streptomyces sp. NPDC004059]